MEFPCLEYEVFYKSILISGFLRAHQIYLYENDRISLYRRWNCEKILLERERTSLVAAGIIGLQMLF